NDGQEDCDNDDLNNTSCTDLFYDEENQYKYQYGTLGCNGSYGCTFDTSNCGYCGDDDVDSQYGEQCELPNTVNNDYCDQAESICESERDNEGSPNSKKIQYRTNDYGSCDGNCGCYNVWKNPICVKDACGADCGEDSHCRTDDNRNVCIDNCECRGCGSADGNDYTATSFYNDDVRNILCELGGTPTITNWEWSCDYGDGNVVEGCYANEVKCATPPEGGNYVSVISLVAAGDRCTAGTPSYPTEENNNTPDNDDDDFFSWNCTDDLVNSISCNARHLKCNEPEPNGEYYGNDGEFVDSINRCNLGDNPFVDDYDQEGDDDLWSWYCKDDRNQRTERCEAYKLKCATPPHNKAYTNQDNFEQGNVECEIGLDDRIFCTGVCNDSSREVEISYDNEDGWSWACGDESCSADLVDCGNYDGDKYIQSSWNDLPKNDSADFCTAGSISSINNLCYDHDYNNGAGRQIPCTDSSADYPGLIDGWGWKCTGDGGDDDYIDCSADRIGCGIAHAPNAKEYSGADEAGIYYDDLSDGDDPEKEGSYREDSELINSNRRWKLCTSESAVNVSVNDNNKGKWEWVCGTDDNGNTEDCEARHSCVLAIENEDGANYAEYETVYFGNINRCWTAEDIADPYSDDSFEYGWDIAVQISHADRRKEWPRCDEYEEWIDCGYQHCKHCIYYNQSHQGACPDGWHVPDDNEWHALEDALDSGLCDGSRDDNAYDCSPAGSTDDNLRDWITFDAKPNNENTDNNGTKFWTKRGFITNNLEFNCYSPPLPYFCRKSPYYYETEDRDSDGTDNEIGRMKDAGYYSTQTSHYLRCVSDISGTTIYPGGGCIGYGCYFSDI
ncbi:MAG: FISUMP domain-containing protein, partial [bacterium]